MTRVPLPAELLDSLAPIGIDLRLSIDCAKEVREKEVRV